MAKKKRSQQATETARPRKRPQPKVQPATRTPKPPNSAFLSNSSRTLSFESPNAPMSLQSPGENPRLEVNVNVQVLEPQR